MRLQPVIVRPRRKLSRNDASNLRQNAKKRQMCRKLRKRHRCVYVKFSIIHRIVVNNPFCTQKMKRSHGKCAGGTKPQDKAQALKAAEASKVRPLAHTKKQRRINAAALITFRTGGRRVLLFQNPYRTSPFGEAFLDCGHGSASTPYSTIAPA